VWDETLLNGNLAASCVGVWNCTAVVGGSGSTLLSVTPKEGAASQKRVNELRTGFVSRTRNRTGPNFQLPGKTNIPEILVGQRLAMRVPVFRSA
jgi:hypothetical protein